MAKPEWGIKRTCQDCGVRFYDMRKDPIICPGCGAKIDPLALLRPRRSRASAPRPVPVPVVVETAAVAEKEEEGIDAVGDVDIVSDDDDDEEEDDLIEDASELGEDDSDFSEVIETSKSDDD